MPRKRSLKLNSEETAALKKVRDHAKQPYLRERASALLKIASGKAAHWVAKEGLLRPYHPDTIYEWLNRYETDGIKGLWIRDGRGRKAAYDP